MFWVKNISSITYFKCTPNQLELFFQFKRWKSSRDHWADLRRQKTSENRALEHFDDFYASVYGDKWRSIRVALLSPHKYCAVVNNFGNIEKTVDLLENEGAHNMKQIVDLQKQQKKFKIDKRRTSSEAKVNQASDKQIKNMDEKIIEENMEQLYSGDVDTTNKSAENENMEELDWSRQIDPNSSTSSASLYDFVPTTELKGKEDWILESAHYSYYESHSPVPIEIVNETDLEFPDHLKVYTFESSNISFFPEPRKGSEGVLSYYLMNASSLLPVLALGLAPGDRVLDMCAAPGGKTIVALQTLYPEIVVSNDQLRSKRLIQVLKDYFYDFEKHVKVMKLDARYIDEADVYNKILVDVPCTNDRQAVKENEYNIFHPGKIKERLIIPELQADILINALKLVSVGGTVVYSTCSLSPIQNDGVVQLALRKIWEQTNRKFIVKNMSKALEPMKIFYRFGDAYRLKYGHLVTPYLPANFGPLYFCKLVRMD